MGFIVAELFSRGSQTLQDRIAYKAMFLEGEVSAGQLLSSLSQGVAKTQSLWGHMFWSLVVSCFTITLNLIFIGIESGPMMFAFASTIPIMYSIDAYKSVANLYGVQYADQIGHLQGMVSNFLSLRQSTKVFNAGPFLKGKWMEQSDVAKLKMFKSLLWANVMQVVYQAMGLGIYVVGIIFVIIKVQNGQFSQSTGFALVGYIGGLLNPLNTLASFNSKVIWAAGAVSDVYSLLKAIEEDEEQIDSLRGNISEKKQTSFHSKADIVIDDITFQYPAADTPTLEHLSLKIEAGDYVSLVGGSGSGKTTLLKLLGKVAGNLLDGGITIGGRPVADFDGVAMVLQQAEVLNGSVKDNISFGGPNDSLEDVIAAAKQAEIHDLINLMPDKYDTIIGSESQVSMSGGQLARLGLARALCRKPRLLLLDEVTSPLDVRTESLILETFRHLHESTYMTIVLCTHSVFAMRSTNQVCMLEFGELSQQGSFDELFKSKGPFYELISDQQLDSDLI